MAENSGEPMDLELGSTKDDGGASDSPYRYRSCESLESTVSHWDSSENLTEALAMVTPRARRRLTLVEPNDSGQVQGEEDALAAPRRALQAVQLDYDSSEDSNVEMEQAGLERMRTGVVEDMDFEDLATVLLSPTRTDDQPICNDANVLQL